MSNALWCRFMMCPLENKPVKNDFTNIGSPTNPEDVFCTADVADIGERKPFRVCRPNDLIE